ncbi:Low-specificity L-threonine aldolase [Citrifermentans bremense]|uniref:Low-specificity L-threonine aldolase n=1 Tax=Citrifermentans bremense TaxID=60035 RepID=A0A6S6M5D1_9BACT|nr:low-specificity L-threonine aldolase [Citrifermentans bremense]BCG48599.1 Low-specificity L-threonine aldolase [Citrifermentans bremense]
MKKVDLRSDTVTLPSQAMRQVLAAAPVGDDVYGEDPTVNRLESMAAELLGKEAALFVPTGTMGNLLALLSHCGRGDEYIAGQDAHIYRWEGGGGAIFGGIQPQPIEFEEDGTLDLDKVRRAVKPSDYHHPVTRLLCLENTQGGKVLPLDYLEKAAELAKSLGLSLHLDGARVFNAAVYLGVPVGTIAARFDSVSVCLSKGLGAPAGTVLCASRELVGRARRWRKVAGGGMRQAGILAAAGIHALENNVQRLAEDHENAELLAAGLGHIEELLVSPARTNILFVTPPAGRADSLRKALAAEGIILGGGDQIRLATHLDVTSADVERTVAAFKRFFAAGGK